MLALAEHQIVMIAQQQCAEQTKHDFGMKVVVDWLSVMG
jgi:hypothetical protein